jgi:hypothetical protein
MKPKIPTNAQTLTNLNLALKCSGTSLTPPPATPPLPALTLTPASPTSPNGKSYLLFFASDGRIGFETGIWNAANGANFIPFIYFPIDKALVWFILETTPTKTYGIEISTKVNKPSSGALWKVTNLNEGSATTFPADTQTLTVTFNAKRSNEQLTLSYFVPESTNPPYHDDPVFYSCKLMLLQ